MSDQNTQPHHPKSSFYPKARSDRLLRLRKSLGLFVVFGLRNHWRRVSPLTS